MKLIGLYIVTVIYVGQLGISLYNRDVAGSVIFTGFIIANIGIALSLS